MLACSTTKSLERPSEREFIKAAWETDRGRPNSKPRLPRNIEAPFSTKYPPPILRRRRRLHPDFRPPLKRRRRIQWHRWRIQECMTFPDTRQTGRGFFYHSHMQDSGL